jgi:uncharacterized protein YecT (DUF1311 family)
MGYALRAAFALGLLLAGGGMALAADKPAGASAKIQDCVKSADDLTAAERCIGIVADPCLHDDKTHSTADMNACVGREQAVWDDILNETYRRLREKLDNTQQEKLRDMQRAWIVSRDKTCAFYWDYFQGTMASPMSASCVNKETASRALFLLGFLNDAEGR